MRRHGFTLIELLIVMLIISVMIGVASLSLKRDYQDLLAQEGQRFKALIALARDEALFQAHSLGVQFNERGYRFVIQGEQHGSWEPLEDKSFRPRQLPSGVQLQVFRNQTPVDLGENATGDVNRLNSVDTDSTARVPQVFILTTGEVTPFQVEFFYPAKARLELSFDALGKSTTSVEEVF